MHLDVCLLCCNDCMLVGLDWAEPMMNLSLHVTCSCIFHVYVPSSFYILIYCLVGAFLIVSFSPFLSFLHQSDLWHPNANPLCPRTLFVLGHPLLLLTLHLLMYGSVMIKLERTFRRTFLKEAFIQNAKSSYQIFLILTYPLSSTVGVGGHCGTSWSLVPP